MTCSTNKSLVEHVSRKMNGDFWEAFDHHCKVNSLDDREIESQKRSSVVVTANLLRAQAAVRATLEYLRDHPTEAMWEAMRLANMNVAGGYGGPSGWEAALSTALEEMEGEQ